MKKIFLYSLLIVCLLFSVAFAGGFDGNTLFFTDSDGTTKIVVNPTGGNVIYNWPTADGTAGYHLETNGSGVLTWGASGTPTMDTVGDPAADVTLTYADNFTDLRTFADTNEDMLNIQGVGAFGDVSVLRVEQKTGAATDGTVLEVVAADANVDPLVVSSSGKANALVVGQNTGVVTVAGVAEGTSALVVTAGDIALTDGDLMVNGGDITATEDISITGDLIGGTGLINYTNFDVDASGNVAAVDGTFSGNVNVTGTFQQDSITAASAATTLTVDGTGVGGVTIGGTSTGTVALGGGATLIDLPSTVDMTISGGDLAVTDTANADMVTFTNNTITTADLLTLTAGGTRTSNNVMTVADGATTGTTIGITANAQTSGNGISYANSGAVLTGAGLFISVTDGAGFTGDYITGYDGAADDFAFKRYGALTIAGNASTDMITVTTGDVQIDDGLIAVDTNEDDVVATFTRNFAGAGTGAAVVIDDTNTSSTNAALSINQDGTGASEGILIAHDGDGAAIEITAGAARTGNVIDIAMANQVAQNGLLIDGAWTGASDVGMINLNPTGSIASGASALRIDTDTGTPAASGFGIEIDDDSVDGGTFYSILINSANNEGLHVEAGVSLFAELATFTAGVTSNGPVALGDADADTITINGNLIRNTETIAATASGTLTTDDCGKTIYLSHATVGIDITLPAVAGSLGCRYKFVQILASADDNTLNTDSGEDKIVVQSFSAAGGAGISDDNADVVTFNNAADTVGDTCVIEGNGSFWYGICTGAADAAFTSGTT